MRIRLSFVVSALTLLVLALPNGAAAQSIGPTVAGPGGPSQIDLLPRQLVQNPGMEQQSALGLLAGWLRVGIASQVSNTTASVWNLPRAHCGSFYAELQAGGASRDAYLVQTLTIPADAPAPQLSFWVNGFGALSTDRLVAQVATSSGNLLLASFGQQVGPTSGWVPRGPFDLSPWRGLTVQLVLRASGSGATSFGIDDVSVLTANPPPTTLVLPIAC